MGFHAHVINRIHYQQKEAWKAERHLEFVWRGSPSLGAQTEMFTHVLDSHYSFPSGFNFEANAPITDLNIAERAQTLATELLRRAAWFRTPYLLVPGGDDFGWKVASVQYNNWDKLIDYINARSDTLGVRLQYATLSDYFGAVHAAAAAAAGANVTWPVYESDFFPYADAPDAYWTGFYTSYSDLKGLIRTRALLLRTAEVFAQAAATISPRESAADALDETLLVPLRQANAVAQHHDAVTGTATAEVVQMYRDHLWEGSDAARKLVDSAMGHLVGGGGADPLSADADVLDGLVAGTGLVVPVVVTNVLGWALEDRPVEIVVHRADLEVLDGNGTLAASQIVALPDDAPDTAYLLTFAASVPAAGFRTYYIRASAAPRETPARAVPAGVTVTLGNAALQVNVTLEEASGALAINVANYVDGARLAWAQQLLEYTSYTGGGQASVGSGNEEWDMRHGGGAGKGERGCRAGWRGGQGGKGLWPFGARWRGGQRGKGHGGWGGQPGGRVERAYMLADPGHARGITLGGIHLPPGWPRCAPARGQRQLDLCRRPVSTRAAPPVRWGPHASAAPVQVVRPGGGAGHRDAVRPRRARPGKGKGRLWATGRQVYLTVRRTRTHVRASFNLQTIPAGPGGHRAAHHGLDQPGHPPLQRQQRHRDAASAALCWVKEWSGMMGLGEKGAGRERAPHHDRNKMPEA